MKTLNRCVLPVLVIILTVFASCQRDVKTITIVNDSSLMRVDEAVTIDRTDFELRYGSLPDGQYPLLVSKNGDIIDVQHDDLTGNGKWDELFFLVDMEPQSSLSFTLKFVDVADLPEIDPRTNIRFTQIQDGEYIPLISGKRLEEGLAAGIYQFEGPGWENDLVGFRNYFDIRNGIDIFGKLTTGMVLDSVGINEDYHVLQPWGMDILKVGTTLGAGSLAIDMDDQIHRVAPEGEGRYVMILEGPLRSTLRFRFDNWLVNDRYVSLIQDITIQGGAWFYESNIYVRGLEDDSSVITGITALDLDDKNAYRELLADSVVAFGTHGKQTIEEEMLGMAVLLDKSSYLGYQYLDVSDDITDTFLIRMQINNKKPIAYRFYSCWELSEPRFAQPDNFYGFLELEAKKMAQPLKVTLE